MNTLTIVLMAAFGLAGLAAGFLAVRFQAGRTRAARVLAAAKYARFDDPGSVKRLEILPLIDDLAAGEGLACESGVSYLIRADDMTLLFDTGLNDANEHPSPLLRNMDELGISVEEIDAVVISHLHLDHVGGMRNHLGRTFDLSARPVDLAGKPAYLPTQMTHPTTQVHIVDGPCRIAPGIASLGPIPRQLFFFGWTPEQSLAINVAGKGLVIIVGCGHSGLQNILERAEAVFDAPIHAVVGGLHYPVTEKPAARMLGSDNWPWKPASKATVEAAIASLQARRPKLVALSPHDSCTWSRDAFRQAFGAAYRDVRVGDVLEV
jgi:7,8-dihydropterin-6-yl-methyl-4-(beta-D-ribofuranosyl)aminobenzene 5'-phosphate synthase